MTRMLEPAEGVDLSQCLATLGTPPSVRGVEKDQHDLWRYERIIGDTRPEILIECGTRAGYSALWFATMVPLVVTVDIDPSQYTASTKGNILRVAGDSADPRVMDAITRCVGPLSKRRIMVSLDSDHSPEHVRAEIQTWARVVSIGCHLVIEDSIYHWADRLPDQVNWDPLPAISAAMPHRWDYVRDRQVEAMFPITGSPAGWWRKVRDRPVEHVDAGGRL